MKLKTSAVLLAVAITTGAVVPTSQSASQSPSLSGEAIFKQRCAVCHSVMNGKPNGVGPNLLGVSGRKAGSGSFAYSAALKNSDLIWTRVNLDRFLAAPMQAVPGTRMVMAVPDAKQRAAVVEFLEKVK